MYWRLNMQKIAYMFALTTGRALTVQSTPTRF